jgi:hypothetical protein
MKIILILICALVFMATVAYAQVPQSFSYQSIARKSTGLPLTSSNIGLRISIRDLSSTGAIVYRETQSATTNAFGLFAISIGSGTVVSGSFATVDWSSGAKFIEIEADFTGGTTYTSMGTSQLLSVPYALYSQNPGPVGPQGPAGPTGAQGPTGLQGPAGATGATGAQGVQGPAGSVGPAGISGANGLSVLSGASDPAPSTGVDGEFYINTITHTLFGPKAAGAWPTGVFLVGPTGAQGLNGLQGPSGLNGLSILSGSSNPLPPTGIDGEFFINTSTSTLFGPKAAGAWPAGISLVGLQGSQGIQGLPGNDGTNGVNGLSVLSGTLDPTNLTGADGEFYINTTSITIFGPKSGGTWPSGVSLTGPTGTSGINGLSILNGSADPTGEGIDGEFYINTTTNTLFGPKAGGVWPIGVLMVGPAGADGSANAWGLLGTTGTVDGTNFIGTTDNVPLSIRVNNEYSGRIDANGRTFFGYQSGRTNTGLQNTGFGFQNLYSNTTGAVNTASGYQALYSNTTGLINTAQGAQALYSNTIGSSNVAVGMQALYANTTGSSNTGIGQNAGYPINVGFANTTGSNNTFIGRYSGPGTGSPLTNAAAIGYEAAVMASNTMQLGNSAVTQIFAGTGNTATLVAGGLRITGGSPAAGKVLTSDAGGVATWQAAAGGSGWGLTGTSGSVDGTNFIGTTDDVPLNFRQNNLRAGRIEGGGTRNTFFGHQAGSTSNGFNNTGSGSYALYTSLGSSNTATGSYVLYNNTGNNNTASGTSALYSNTTGHENTASGASALVGNTTGFANTAIGQAAMLENVAGSSGTAVGFEAMRFANNTATPFTNTNVAVGNEALRGSITPSDNTGLGNTAVGYRGLWINTSGSNNTTTGLHALRDNTTGNDNTAIGRAALFTNATGSNNTALGNGADVGSTALNNATAIGNGAIVAASNTMQLGNSAVTQVFAGTGTNATLVAGGLKVTGGSLAAGKVLTSDAGGVATWQAAAPSGWGLTGTSGSVDGTNFIGTTDDVPLNFRQNNLRAGRVEGSSTRNTFFGHQAGTSNASSGNTGMGSHALYNNTLGGGNTASGEGALYGNTTGDANTASGSGALNSNTIGTGNTAIGNAAMYSNVAGSSGTAIGRQAMQWANNTATPFTNTNVAIGNEAIRGSITPSNNSGLGNTAIGYRGLWLNTSGSNNTTTGLHALRDNTSGNDNTAIGRAALFTNATGSNNTALGNGADVGSTALNNATALGNGAIVTASNTMQLGNSAVTQIIAGTGNTATLVAGGLKITGGSLAAGKVLTSDASGVATWQTAGGGWGLTGSSGTVDGTNFIGTTDGVPLNFRVSNIKAGKIDLLNNTFMGLESGNVNATGSENVAIGTRSLLVNTASKDNAAIGYDALVSNTGASNTAVGRSALAANTTGQFNTAIGRGADVSTGSLTNATAIGAGAVVSASNTIQLGNSGVTQVLAGTGNTATLVAGGLKITGGSPATGKVLTSDATGVATWQAAGGGWGLTGTSGTVNGTNFIGTTDNVPLTFRVNNIQAGKIDASDLNAFFGYQAGLSTASGANHNTASGANALFSNSLGSANTATGSSALLNNSTGNSNTAIGVSAMSFNLTGTGNTAIGRIAMTSNVAGSSGTAVGFAAMQFANSTTTPFTNTNVAVGYEALRGLPSPSENTGLGNTVVGYQAMLWNASGGNNTVSGSNALQANASGNDNTAIGRATLITNLTGSNNTALGSGADVGSAALNNATAIGNGAIVAASNTMQLGNSAVTQVFAGTGTNATLVAGGLKITGGSPAAGKVLTSDATGIATWQAAGGGSGWGLTGSAGTVDGTSFIGTTDNVPLNFRVNNTKAGRIDQSLNNTFMGLESGNSNAGGNGNTAFGNRTLRANTAGNDNAAFGDNALFNNTGAQNTAVGAYSLYTNTSGQLNTATGDLALYANTTGSNNTALGFNTLASNTTGQSNTAIGRGANVSTGNLTNATAIGADAVVNASNTIQLGNSSVSEATLGNGSSSILKVGEVRAGGSGEYYYTSARTRYLTLGNAAFVAAGPDGMTASRNVTTVTGIPTSVYTLSGPASPGISSFTAQVDLPNGAIVTGLTAYVFDTNATYDLSVILTRQRVGLLQIDNLASITSTGAPSAATYTTSSIANATVDNSEYSYQVVFQSLANGNHAVYNIKITYTVGRAD